MDLPVKESWISHYVTKPLKDMEPEHVKAEVKVRKPKEKIVCNVPTFRNSGVTLQDCESELTKCWKLREKESITRKSVNQVKSVKPTAAKSPVVALRNSMNDVKQLFVVARCDCHEIDSVKASFDAVASLISHQKTANMVKALGGAAITLAQVVMGIMNPYVGIITSALSLFSMFGTEDSDDDQNNKIMQALMQGIAYLSEQMYQYHIENREQFRSINKKLDKHHAALLEQFFSIHQGQDSILEKIHELGKYVLLHHESIQNELVKIRSDINSGFKMTIDSLAGIRIEDIDEIIENLRFITQDEDASPADFSKYVRKLFVKATVNAAADSLTGNNINIDSTSEIQLALEKQPTNCINLLSKLTRGNEHEHLVNVLVWLRCARVVVEFIQPDRYAKYARQLRKIKRDGEKLIEFIDFLDTHLDTLCDEYKQCTEEHYNELSEKWGHFLKKQTKKLERHRAIAIEAEKIKLKGVLLSYECTECVKHIENSIKKTHAACAPIDDGSNGSWPHSMRHEGKCVAVGPMYEEGKWVVQKNVRDPSTFFKNFFTYHYAKVVHITASCWLYPENAENPILALPAQPLPINAIYIEAEKLGLGTIVHKYDIDAGFRIRTYFQTKSKSTEILRMRGSYWTDKLYNDAENVLHYWYGGRYPKTHETYLVYGAPYQLDFSGYYPGVRPKDAMRQQFVTTAKRKILSLNTPKIQALIDKYNARLEREFLQTIPTSTNSLHVQLINCALLFVHGKMVPVEKNQRSAVEFYHKVTNKPFRDEILRVCEVLKDITCRS